MSRTAVGIAGSGQCRILRGQRPFSTRCCSATTPERSSASIGSPSLGSTQIDSIGKGGSSNDSSSSSSSSSFNGSSKLTGSSPSARPAAQGAACHVRPAESSDYWAVADLHCYAFYPRAAPFWFAALRVDRVMAMQLGKERQELGNFLCLVAEGNHESVSPNLSGSKDSSTNGSGSSIGSSSSSGRTLSVVAAGSQKEDRVDLGPLVNLLVATVFPPSMRQNYGSSYSAGGLRGVAVVDTFGEHVPRKRKQMPNGSVREVRRTAIAYLSNVAVAPDSRRAGIGLRLLHEAEQAAIAWGCRSMALHVDPTNTAALQMYRRAGYRHVMNQPEWQRWLEGRQTPLALMMRALPRRTAQLQAQAASAPPAHGEKQEEGLSA